MMADLSDGLVGTGDKNYFFLKSLDERLHYTIKDNLGAIWDSYHFEQRLTKKELARVMRLLNKEAGDYVIAPENTNMGLSAGFAVYKIGIEGMEYTADAVLRFTEKQLPANVNWVKMAEMYMGERNLELLVLMGIDKPVPDRSRYDY